MKITQQEIDPNSITGILERYHDLLNTPPKARKNTKVYKEYNKKVDRLRLDYNLLVGFPAFILMEEENMKEWRAFIKSKNINK